MAPGESVRLAEPGVGHATATSRRWARAWWRPLVQRRRHRRPAAGDRDRRAAGAEVLAQGRCRGQAHVPARAAPRTCSSRRPRTRCCTWSASSARCVCGRWSTPPVRSGPAPTTSRTASVLSAAWAWQCGRPADPAALTGQLRRAVAPGGPRTAALQHPHDGRAHVRSRWSIGGRQPYSPAASPSSRCCWRRRHLRCACLPGVAAAPRDRHPDGAGRRRAAHLRPGAGRGRDDRRARRAVRAGRRVLAAADARSRCSTASAPWTRRFSPWSASCSRQWRCWPASSRPAALRVPIRRSR